MLVVQGNRDEFAIEGVEDMDRSTLSVIEQLEARCVQSNYKPLVPHLVCSRLSLLSWFINE